MSFEQAIGDAEERRTSELKISNVFYVANASSYGLRVESCSSPFLPVREAHEDVHEVNKFRGKAIASADQDYPATALSSIRCSVYAVPIKTGECREFKGTFVRISDDQGEMIYTDTVAPGKSLIVTYSDASSGYECRNYHVRESKDTVSDTSDEASIWTTPDNANLKGCASEKALCEFCVANSLDTSLIVLHGDPEKPSSLKVGPLECSVPINSRIVGIMLSDNEPILKGDTALYSNRAIIVTRNKTIKRSIIIDKDNKGTAVWIDEQDERNHFPNFFYVANASGVKLLVKAFPVKPSVQIHDTAKGWKEEKDTHLLAYGEYEEYQGGHVAIWKEVGNRICNVDISAGRSLIVTGPSSGNIVVSDNVDKSDVLTTVWMSKKINYRPVQPKKESCIIL